MFIFLIFYFIQIAYSDLTHETRGTSVRVLGQSGKVTVERGENTYLMTMDYLHELDNNGNQVGKVGSIKHSIESFASQSFTFSSPVTKQYQNTSIEEFSFQSSVGSIGKLNVVTMIISDFSSVATETESWTVQPGDLKWNIELLDWSFCDPCNDGTASYVELGIEIKGSQNKRQNNKTYDLGGAMLQLSNRVVVDGDEIDMPDSYPKIVEKGNKQLFVFRFPKFAEKLTYDPILQIAPEETNNAKRIQVNFLLILFLTLNPIKDLIFL